MTQQELEQITFPVVEIFNSIQGEGIFTGRSAIFVRLSGCNLKCPWCDTDHSPKMGNMTLRQIVDKIVELDEKPGLIVFTGGEPTIHKNLHYLLWTVKLKFNQDGKDPDIAIETNGTNPLMLYRLKTMHVVDLITVSPKDNMFDDNINDSLLVADEVKVVLSDVATPEIYEPALAKHFAHHTAFIQPCSENFAPVIEFIKKHPQWRISVQIQKVLKVF